MKNQSKSINQSTFKQTIPLISTYLIRTLMCTAVIKKDTPTLPMNRCLPSSGRMNGIMRVRTLTDSLSSCDSDSSHSARIGRSKSLVADEARPSSVRFNEVRIREYAVTIGDNPSCSNGVPVSLDWMHTPCELCVHVDKYEEARQPHRRDQAQLKMPSLVRLELLVDEWDHSMHDVMTAQQETSRVRAKRMKTSIKARRAILREESFGAMKKSLKKLFTISNNRSSKKDKQDDHMILFGAEYLTASDDESSSSDEEI